jgi:hypothetical protein
MPRLLRSHGMTDCVDGGILPRPPRHGIASNYLFTGEVVMPREAGYSPLFAARHATPPLTRHGIAPNYLFTGEVVMPREAGYSPLPTRHGPPSPTRHGIAPM